jgi:hypothetical protein
MGGVYSRTEGFTDLVAMAPGLAFHTVCMVIGTALVARASAAKRALHSGATLAKQS